METFHPQILQTFQLLFDTVSELTEGNGTWINLYSITWLAFSSKLFTIKQL